MVGAVILHLVALALLCLLSAKGEVAPSGQGSVALTIIVGSGSASGSAPVKASALTALMDRFPSDASSSAAPAPSEDDRRARMAELFGDGEAQAAAPAGGGAAGAPRSGLANVDLGAAASMPTAGGWRATGSSGSDLWSQVARCWRRPSAAPAVRMQISLDERGALLAQPQAIRKGGGGVGRDQLIAETAAASALIACAPYRWSGTRRDIELEFRPGRD